MRFILNGVISGVLVIIFERLGWIVFLNPPTFLADAALNGLLIAFIIGVLIGVMMTVVGLLFAVYVVATCFLGCLLAPIFLAFLGYLALLGVSLILPEWFAISTPSFIQDLIMSVALGVFRYPEGDRRRRR